MELESTKNSEKARADIIGWLKRREGYLRTPRLDPNGKQVNIGYGHKINTSGNDWKKLVWSEEKATQELWKDFLHHRKIAESLVGNRKISERTKDLLGLINFNSDGRFLRSQRFNRVLNSGDEGRIVEDTLRLNTVNGKADPGLTVRRLAEAAWARGKPFPQSNKEAASVFEIKAEDVPDKPLDFLDDDGGLPPPRTSIWEKFLQLTNPPPDDKRGIWQKLNEGVFPKPTPKPDRVSEAVNAKPDRVSEAVNAQKNASGLDADSIAYVRQVMGSGVDDQELVDAALQHAKSVLGEDKYRNILDYANSVVRQGRESTPAK